jgi:hypothetical protein
MSGETKALVKLIILVREDLSESAMAFIQMLLSVTAKRTSLGVGLDAYGELNGETSHSSKLRCRLGTVSILCMTIFVGFLQPVFFGQPLQGVKEKVKETEKAALKLTFKLRIFSDLESNATETGIISKSGEALQPLKPSFVEKFATRSLRLFRRQLDLAIFGLSLLDCTTMVTN